MGKLETLFKEHWTEPRPAPLVLSAEEVLAWENEYVEKSYKEKATAESLGGTILHVDGISPTKGETLSEAVMLAAAKQQIANQ
jgi:hypothetical protein